MKVISNLPGQHHKLDLIELRGKHYLRKTMSPEELWSEKAFIELLKQHGIPCVSYHPHKLLGPNQLLLTYIPGSPSLEYSDQPYDFYRIGKTMRAMHRITFSNAHRINELGKEVPLKWGATMEELYHTALSKLSFPTSLVQLVTQGVQPLFYHIPDRYTLVHGDLQRDNMLRLQSRVVFIDKDSSIFAGDPLYDLGLWYLQFIHSLFIPGTHQEESFAREAHRAFVEGYGYSPHERQGTLLERYMLLRTTQLMSQERLPLTPLIQKLAERLS